MSSEKKKNCLLWILVSLLLLIFGLTSSVAYWKLDRDSSNRIARLQKEQAASEERLEKMLSARDDLESDVDELKTALDELQKQKQITDRRISEFKDLLIRFQSVEGLTVRIDRGRMVLSMSSDVLFPSGSGDLSETGEKTVRKVAQVLKGIEGRKFQIEGHTDSDPILKPEKMTNWELASKRSLNVLHTMIEEGVRKENISAASYGDSLPVASNATAAGKAKNRRIEIVLMPDLSELPGAKELKKLGNDASGGSAEP